MSSKKASMTMQNTTRQSMINSTSRFESNIVTSEGIQKNMQHQLDIVYSKHLRCLAMQKYTAKKNQEVEQAIDEQLSNHADILQKSVEEMEGLKNLMNYSKKHKNLFFQLLHIEKLLEEGMPENLQNSKDIALFAKQLQTICDKLYLENTHLNNDTSSVVNLILIAESILNNTENIVEETSEDYFKFIEHIRNIQNISKMIQNVQENVSSSQSTVNKMVIKAASMQLALNVEI